VTIEIRITIPDKGEGLERFEQKLDRLPEMWRIVERRELEMTKDRFASKTTPDGKAWPANAPLTLMLRRGGSMMNVSGALKGSITAEGSGLRSVIEPHMVYAAIHQFGGTILPKKGKFLRIPIGAGSKMSKEGASKLFHHETKFGEGKDGVKRGVATTRGRKGEHGRTKEAGFILLTKVTIPAREYLGIGAKDREMIEETVREWFSL